MAQVKVSLPKIQEMFEMGSTREEISKELNIPMPVVKQAFDKLGLKGKKAKTVYLFEEDLVNNEEEVITDNQEVTEQE